MTNERCLMIFSENFCEGVDTRNEIPKLEWTHFARKLEELRRRIKKSPDRGHDQGMVSKPVI